MTTISVFGVGDATKRLSSDRFSVTQEEPLRTEMCGSFGRDGRVWMLVDLKAVARGRKRCMAFIDFVCWSLWVVCCLLCRCTQVW